jgi:regulator of replication initiation timing
LNFKEDVENSSALVKSLQDNVNITVAKNTQQKLEIEALKNQLKDA